MKLIALLMNGCDATGGTNSYPPGTRYDVIDRAGNRVGQIVLPGNEYILGFGAKSVYVVVTDDDGIQRLRRHPMYSSLRP